MESFSRLIFFLFVTATCFASTAHACRPLISDERSEKVIETAAFIGVAKITNIKKTKEDMVASISLIPLFSYRETNNFDPKSNIKIDFDTTQITSCDYKPRSQGQLLEVIIYEEENGTYRLGNKVDMALGHYWQKLRKEVRYVE